MNLKILFSLGLLCFALSSASAQALARQVNASAGGSFSNAQFSLMYTIGEPLVNTLSAGSATFTQGFQQADPSTGSGIFIPDGARLSALLYPNPTGGNATLKIENAGKDLQLALYDQLGRQVFHTAYDAMVNTGQNIPLNNLQPGIYYLKINSSDNLTFETIQITKL